MGGAREMDPVMSSPQLEAHSRNGLKPSEAPMDSWLNLPMHGDTTAITVLDNRSLAAGTNDENSNGRKTVMCDWPLYSPGQRFEPIGRGRRILSFSQSKEIKPNINSPTVAVTALGDGGELKQTHEGNQTNPL